MLDSLKASVLAYARRMAHLGLVPNTQGNVSARDPATGLVVITPHDLAYDVKTPDDLVVVDPQGRKVEGARAPSNEMPVHCAVYRNRPGVGGVVHAEPVTVNCFGALGIPIPPVVVGMLIAVGGDVPVMPFTPHTGTAKFGEDMLALMGDRTAVIWGNHGMLSFGRDLDAAFRVTVMVEHAAQVYHLARQLGTPVIVTPAMLHAPA